MCKCKITMLNLPNGLTAEIEQVTEFQIDELIQIVIRQYNNLHPGQEGVFISLPQDPQKRNEELKEIIRLLRLPKNKA